MKNVGRIKDMVGHGKYEYVAVMEGSVYTVYVERVNVAKRKIIRKKEVSMQDSMSAVRIWDTHEVS